MTNVRDLADYQDFGMDSDGLVIRIGDRMGKKLAAIDKFGGFEQYARDKAVLDVGCDMGFWSFLAAGNYNAKLVVGLDRNRPVRGVGFTDLVALNTETAKSCLLEFCEFYETEVGTQYHWFGRFDTVLMFSMYHHAYQAAGGDHNPVWYWLRRHLLDTGTLLWENPWDLQDGVADAHVKANRDGYNWAAMAEAFAPYFGMERMTSANHVLTRTLVKLTPKPMPERSFVARVKPGAGGASKAFMHADGRRIEEIRRALGFAPFPGSLNLELEEPFEWNRGYYRTQILDVVNRRDLRGLNQEWRHRWCRLYPVRINGANAYALRFEGEKYRDTLVELIAAVRLRDRITTELVELVKEG